MRNTPLSELASIYLAATSSGGLDGTATTTSPGARPDGGIGTRGGGQEEGVAGQGRYAGSLWIGERAGGVRLRE